jgi:membrane-bound lytic murein transglycosylase D
MQKLLMLLACTLSTGCSDCCSKTTTTIACQQNAPTLSFGVPQKRVIQHHNNSGLPPHFWKTLHSQFRLPISHHPLVQQQQQRYLKDKYHLQQVTTRAQPYLDWIITQIKQRQLPMELLLLPMVESAFDPHAYSNKHAAGLWQITPQTGRYYGLTVNQWYDGRCDIVQATEAALTLISDLNQRFNGDWLLTLAAYNSGAFRVAKAVKAQQKRAGDAVDFWSLELPQETMTHVIKLLAISALFQHPNQQLLNLPDLDNQQSLSYIDVGQPFSLSQAATMADLPLARLKAFNPGYRRASTATNGPYHLLLPRNRMARFKQALATATHQQRLLVTQASTRAARGQKNAGSANKL